MKKYFSIPASFILFTTVILAQSITVTKPVGGTGWIVNAEHRIEWIYRGEMNANVKIRLYNADGSRKIKDVVNSVGTANRLFTCPVNFFNDVPAGTYLIRVKTVDNTFFDDSDPFYITGAVTIDRTVDVAGSPDSTGNQFGLNPPPNSLLGARKVNGRIQVAPPSILITYPDRNVNWRLKLGNTSLPFPIRVLWKKTGIGTQDSRVRILLKRKIADQYMRKTIILTQSTANNGLFTGGIPRDLRTSLYSVIIVTLDGKIQAESENFYITNAENDTN